MKAEIIAAVWRDVWGNITPKEAALVVEQFARRLNGMSEEDIAMAVGHWYGGLFAARERLAAL